MRRILRSQIYTSLRVWLHTHDFGTQFIRAQTYEYSYVCARMNVYKDHAHWHPIHIRENLCIHKHSHKHHGWSGQGLQHLLGATKRAFSFSYIFWNLDHHQRFPPKSTEIWRYRKDRFCVLKFPSSPLQWTCGTVCRICIYDSSWNDAQPWWWRSRSQVW